MVCGSRRVELSSLSVAVVVSVLQEAKFFLPRGGLRKGLCAWKLVCVFPVRSSDLIEDDISPCKPCSLSTLNPGPGHVEMLEPSSFRQLC